MSQEIIDSKSERLEDLRSLKLYASSAALAFDLLLLFLALLGKFTMKIISGKSVEPFCWGSIDFFYELKIRLYIFLMPFGQKILDVTNLKSLKQKRTVRLRLYIT